MSSLPGKRPLAHLAAEAETNGVAIHHKRRREREGRRRSSFPSSSSSSSSSSSTIYPPSSSSFSSPFWRDQTVFRILCPAGKTGSVIGKGGSIIQSIRRDTGAMVRIEDAVIGCDERVVAISAKEEGFKPQKFRGPGNYRKSMDDKVIARESDDKAVDTGGEDGKGIVAAEDNSKDIVSGGGDGKGAIFGGEDSKDMALEVGGDYKSIVLSEEEGKIVHDKDVGEEDGQSAVGEDDGKGAVAEEGGHAAVADGGNAAVPEEGGEASLAEDDGKVSGEEDGKVSIGEDGGKASSRENDGKASVVEEDGKGCAGEDDGKLCVGEEQEQEHGKGENLCNGDEENHGFSIHNGENGGMEGRHDGNHENDELGAYSGGIAPVQEALLRVHQRIMEVEPSYLEGNAEQPRGEVCTRLLVPTTQVGCLLGKRGKIISQIRQDSGAQIRVLPRNQIPLCALPSDELVQITGDLIAIKKALLAVSTQLRNNPPKKENEDMAAASIKLSHSVESTYMGGNMLSNSAMMGRPLSPRLPLGEKEDLTFRILCSKDKIGSIIGKGGSIVRSIRDETGAKISIDVSSDVGDERVVRVSAPEMPEDPFSKAQKAVMIVHSKILFSDRDKDGIVNTKLLVPADQAGCLLGRGGHIMIEMRKMTRAKIHIHGKEGLPPCAAHTDELVEIIGNFMSSQEALMQITTKLRNNFFLTKFGPSYIDPKPLPYSGMMPKSEVQLSLRAPIMPVSAPYDGRYTPYPDVPIGYNEKPSFSTWPPQDFGGNMHPDLIGGGHSRDHLGDARANTTFIASQTVEVVVPEHAIASIVGDSGSNMQQICKISGAKVKLKSLISGSSERIVEISGTPDQTHAAQSLLQAFVLSGQ